jgi:hypothetical protein
MIVLMEQSKKEELLREVEIIVHREVAPVLDILMEYLDVRFDEMDERFLFVFGGINQLIEKLSEALDSSDPAD